MKRYIWITTQFEGFHFYKNAPKGVDFLKNKHRHIFKTKVWIEVFSDDREIEFILFKRFIEKLIKNNNFNYKSCEMISNDIYEKIIKEYPNREIWIEISEDGENASFTIYSIHDKKNNKKLKGGKKNGKSLQTRHKSIRYY